MSRPWTVPLIAVLLVVTGLVRVAGLLTLTGGLSVLPVMGLVALVVSLMIAAGLLRGRRGTATIALVVLVLGGAQALLTATEPDPTAALLGAVEAGLSVVGIALLVLPVTRRHLGRRTVAPAYGR